MLLLGRIFAMACADQTLYYTLEKLQIPNTKVMPLMTINQVSTGLYFSKASTRTELISPLTRALSGIREKGVINSIFYKNGYIPGRSTSTSHHP